MDLYTRRINIPPKPRNRYLQESNVGGATTIQSGGSGSSWLEQYFTSDGEGNLTINTSLFSQGNVGIGTTNPTERLDVNGNIKASGNINVATTVTGGLTSDARLAGLRFILSSGHNYIQSSSNRVSGDWVDIRIGQYLNTNTKVWIGSNGVKIGGSGYVTSAPTEALDVNGVVKASKALVCSQAAGDDSHSGLSLYKGSDQAHEYGIQFMKTSTSGYGTHGSVTGDWATYFNMSGTSTNVSNRGWIFRNNYTNSGAVSISADGNITAIGEVTAYSDRRLKSEFEVIKDSLTKIKQLSGYTYTKDNRRSAGVVAQEVRDVLPEAIHGKETEDTYLSVNDAAMTGLLIECIKELTEKVEKLEEIICN